MQVALCLQPHGADNCLVGEESDYPSVAQEDIDDVQLAVAQHAALSCPEKAIIIIE